MTDDAAARPGVQLDTTVSHSARIWNYWTDQAYSIVRHLVSALAPGSFLTINHSTSAINGAAMEEAVAHWNQVGTPSMTLRTPGQITRFFDGVDLVPPGVVSCSRWRPDLTPAGSEPPEVDEFSGVARKPPAPGTPA